VPRDREIPSADILVSTVYRLVRRADPLLASVHLVHEGLTVSRHNYNVIPVREQFYAEPGGEKALAKIFNLRALPGPVEAGEADQ